MNTALGLKLLTNYILVNGRNYSKLIQKPLVPPEDSSEIVD